MSVNQSLLYCHFLSYFFGKKIPLSRRVGYVMDGSMDEWVRDVYMSHQSDWIYYKQPIKFLVIKVNGMWEDLIPTQFRTAIFLLRTAIFHILGLLRHFQWVRLRILVTNEMSLEVWNRSWFNSMQMQRDIFIFSYKGNLILLFFTRSKFN